MNLYFLLEGKRTEKKVYPMWMDHLLPNYKQVKSFDEADQHNYFLFSANGYPDLLNDIENAISDINECRNYSYFLVCLDADESSVEERRKEVMDKIESSPSNLNAKPVVIVQNKCFETWFLGNQKVFPRNPQDEDLQEYCRFYNVSNWDPELMPQYPGFGSTSQFHSKYLKLMLKEKNISYTKQHPGQVGESHYIDALHKRVTSCPTHLKSLQNFFSFIHRLKNS